VAHSLNCLIMHVYVFKNEFSIGNITRKQPFHFPKFDNHCWWPSANGCGRFVAIVREESFRTHFDNLLVGREEAFHTPFGLSGTDAGLFVEFAIQIVAGLFLELGIQMTRIPRYKHPLIRRRQHLSLIDERRTLLSQPRIDSSGRLSVDPQCDQDMYTQGTFLWSHGSGRIVDG
jgi:hypothetical protein